MFLLLQVLIDLIKKKEKEQRIVCKRSTLLFGFYCGTEQGL